jgi:transcriptional regulator with XRE-family HTH domain
VGVVTLLVLPGEIDAHLLPRLTLCRSLVNQPQRRLHENFLKDSLTYLTHRRFYVFRREKASETYDYRGMSYRNKLSSVIFGRRLRHVRQLRHLAQDQLGVMAGLEESSSSARMSRYESGIHEPPFHFVEVLATVLDVSPAYFYCPDDRLADIILVYSGVSEPSRQALHQAAKVLCEQN